MKKDAQAVRHSLLRRLVLIAIVFLAIASIATAAQDVALHLDSQHTTINFTLGDVLHTVHGTFRLKQGSLRLDSASGKLTGEIVVDAKSGESGNGMRDRKMHREVLESDRYPKIAFRPDRIDGTVSLQGKSSVRVHGIFTIHGSDHELTVPAEVEMSPDRWNGNASLRSALRAVGHEESEHAVFASERIGRH
jgi:polyisoprenoid-binding protein YceI